MQLPALVSAFLLAGVKSDIGKRVGTWPMRAMAFGGMKTGDIPGEKLTAIVQRSGTRVELKLPQ
jgi:hypothetical protein